MQKYLETFFRHRRALVAPVVVALVISVGFVIVQPRSYDASARVWFQSTAIAGSDSASQVNTYLNPSEVALGVFNELLSTRSFCVNIGHRGPLADYLSNNLPAPDPISLASGLLDKVRGGGGTSAAARQQILDDTIVAILQKQVVFTATGPQIVTIDFVYTNPYIAKGTLRVLLDEFRDQMLTVQRAQTGQQLSSTNQQVTDQQKTVNTADASVARYLALHPELRVAQPPPDATYSGLQQVADQAHTQLAQLVTARDQAQIQQNLLNQGTTSLFRVIDPAALPDRPVSFSKTLLLGVAGGLGVGLLLSLVTLVVLVFTDHTARTADDVERSLGVKVVGVIPFRPVTATEDTREGQLMVPPSSSPSSAA
jgi:capsular polysaccharide biosynthesis protein